MSNYVELKQNLLGGDLESLSNKVFRQLQSLQSLREELESYVSSCIKITARKTSSELQAIQPKREIKCTLSLRFSSLRRDNLLKMTTQMQDLVDTLRNIESLQVPPNLKKMLRRMGEAYSEVEAAQKLMTEIEKKQKLYVKQARMSAQNNQVNSTNSYEDRDSVEM